MTDALRAELWTILCAAFQSVCREVQYSIPAATVTMGHSHNDVFPFRAYAEFVNVNKVVVISFDIESRGSEIHSVGDMSLETGQIVETLLSATNHAMPSIDAALLSHAQGFSLKCHEVTEQLIATLLGGRKGTEKGGGRSI